MSNPVKIDRSVKHGRHSGGLGIEILFPGLVLENGDSGVGAIGRIDHAHFRPGSRVPMHPHKNDEILTYLRAGAITHYDTVGHVEEVTPQRLMLMNAGHTFQHEEVSAPDSEPLAALQIFMRPRAEDLEPMVQFHDFDAAYSLNQWRLLAGPTEAPLVLRAEAWIHDARLLTRHTLRVPETPAAEAARLLYVFSGAITVAGLSLKEGESAFLDGNQDIIEAVVQSDLVFFTTDLSAPVFKKGMFSGNVLSA